MSRASAARLVLLAAIWGASFLFVRIAAPVIGPVATADLRMLVGGGALAAYYAATGFDAKWRRWWPHYLAIGALNCAAPFLLYGYAALALTAGLLAVLNATSPMWGALLSVLVLRERLSGPRLAGLLFGVAGVALVCTPERSAGWLAVAAGLAAAFCYALTGVILKRWASEASARGMAAGTQMMGGLLVLPLLALAPPGGIHARHRRRAAGARTRLRRARLRPLLPADRRPRSNRGAHRHVPDPPLRRSLGRALSA